MSVTYPPEMLPRANGEPAEVRIHQRIVDSMPLGEFAKLKADAQERGFTMSLDNNGDYVIAKGRRGRGR